MCSNLFRLSTVAIVLITGLSQGQTVYQWPAVLPLEKTFYIEDAGLASVDVSIAGTDKKPLYRLSCRGRGKFHEDTSFDYSGDFECRLTSLYSKDHYSTLLTEDPRQERDWESRGRFGSEEVVGQCEHYPEYGRLRHFRLRGMKLTLELNNIGFYRGRRPGDSKNTDLLKSFRFVVRVGPDPTALSTIAEDVPFVDPPSIQRVMLPNPLLVET